MAKKNDKGGSLIILFLLLLGLAIIATPLVMFFGTLFSIFSYVKVRSKIKGEYSDFWLNESDKLDFKRVSTKVVEAIEKIEEAKKLGQEEGLAKNRDGSFALRGNRGKEVQAFINSNQNIIDRFNPIFQAIKSSPQERWVKFRKSYTRFYSFLIGSVCWLISTSILISKEFSDFSYGASTIIKFPVDLFSGQTGAEHTDKFLQWKILLISAGITLVVYLIILLVSKETAKKVSPIPPEVSLSNYNKY